MTVDSDIYRKESENIAAPRKIEELRDWMTERDVECVEKVSQTMVSSGAYQKHWKSIVLEAHGCAARLGFV